MQAIESDMDVMIKYFDELNEVGAQLVKQIGGSENSTKEVNSQLQNCQDRWDNLVQRMERCSKQVRSRKYELCKPRFGCVLVRYIINKAVHENVHPCCS